MIGELKRDQQDTGTASRDEQAKATFCVGNGIYLLWGNISLL